MQRIALLALLVSAFAQTPIQGQELWSCQARALDDARVLLIWKEFPGADAYRVYRTTSQGGSVENSTTFMATAADHYLDSGLAENGTYFYRVVAENPAGDILGMTPEVSATTTADVTPARLLSIDAPSATSLDLRFDEPIDTLASATAFEVSGLTIESVAAGELPGQVILTTTPQPHGTPLLKVMGALDQGFSQNSTTTAARFLTSGALLASFPLNDGAGSIATDVTGHMYMATVEGATWENGALHFGGGADRVLVPDIPLSGRTMTLSTWVRVDSFGTGEGRIISKASGLGEDQHVFMLGFMPGEREHSLRFRLSAGGTTTTLINEQVKLPAFEWVHVAATYDGVWMRIYQNGVEIASAAKNGDIDPGLGVPLALGNQPQADNPAEQRPLVGALRDVRIYGRRLNATEVAFLAAPMATPGDDTGVVEFGGSTVISVLDNDDPGSPLVGAPWIDVVMPPRYGNVVVDGNGNIHYHHLGSSIEPDRFTYMLRNPTFASVNKATVEIQVLSTPLWAVGLALQLDAESGVVMDGDNVTSWQDLSGAGNHMQMFGTPQYVTGVLRGRQVVRFDAQSRGENVTGLAGIPNGNANRTMLAVVHYASGGESLLIGSPECGEGLSLGRLSELGDVTVGNGCQQLVSTPTSHSGWFVQSVTLKDGEVRLYVDGVVQQSAPATMNTSMDMLRVGGSSQIDVAAILVYDYALSEDTHALVYEYLRQHYFLDGDGTPAVVEDFVRARRGMSTPLDVLSNDFADFGVDPTTVTIVDPPLYGTATVDPVSGIINYTHGGTSLLPDRLSYTVRDGLGVQSPPIEVWIGIDGYHCALSRDGVVLHLDAGRGVIADETGAVLEWHDSTILGNDLMATTGAMLVPNAVFGHDVVSLDSASLIRSGALVGFPVAGADRTLLVVANKPASMTSHGAVTYGDSGCGTDFGLQLGDLAATNGCPITGSVPQATGWGVFTVVLENGTSSLYQNGTLVTSAPLDVATPGMRFLIEGTGLDVAEVILYDRALSDLDRARAEAHLREKYVDEICDPPCWMPEITTDLVDTAVCTGSAAILEFDAYGDDIAFQWYRDMVAIPGATGTTLPVAAGDLDHQETYRVFITSSCGDTWSSSATVRTIDPVQMVSMPQSQQVCAGDTATWSVEATGSELEFEWRADGVLLDSVSSTATGLSHNSTLNLVTDSSTPAMQILELTVRNGCSAITTLPFQLTVDQAPVVRQQPSSRSVCAGDDVTLTVMATAPLAISYQWCIDGQPIPGATSSELTLTNVTTAHEGSYTTLVETSCGSVTTSAALMVVTMPPQIVSPVIGGGSFCEGAIIELSSFASGDGNSFQWRRDGIDILGAVESTLMIGSAIAADAGNYDVVVTNSCGSVTSDPVTVVVYDPIAIDSQPSGGMHCVGDLVTLSVGTTGAAESWQWRRDGVAIPGAINANLVLNSIALDDAGLYDVVVAGPCGEVTSAAVNIEVFGVPQILLDLAPITTCEGFPVELTILASGSGDLSYQWRRNGMNMPGANDATLFLPMVRSIDRGLYDVVITSNCGAVVVDAVMLTVTPQMECDCNGNGVLDGDDIAAGDATDCNNNGVIDSCDIAVGLSLDDDGDGMPDDCRGMFRRGDVNGDNLQDLADAIVLLDFLLSQGGGSAIDCPDAADFNDDGEVNLIDVIANLIFTFGLGTATPAPPYPNCGADPTFDALGCDRVMCQ